MEKEELKQGYIEMAKYLLDGQSTDDKEVIESYAESLYQPALEFADLQNPKWIRVNERLPKYKKPVFLSKNKEINIGVRANTDIEGEHYNLFNGFKNEDGKITHWAEIELIDPPK